MKRFIAVVIAVLAISLLVSCGNLSLAGKNASLPNKNGKGTISIRMSQETPINASRAGTIPTQNDVTKYQIAIYTTSDHKVEFSDMDITPEKMAEGIKKELAYGTYAVSVNALRGDEIIFRGVSGSVEITKDNTEDNPAQAEVDMKQILAVYDNGTESENHLWEKYIGEADATHLSWILPSIDDVTDDSWKIDGKEVIGWKITETGFEYDAGDKIWLSGKTLPLHLEAIWAEPDTAEPIVKLIEFFTHDGSILSAEQENFAITSEELAEDGTFELGIEELTAYLQGWGANNLPVRTTFDGWKDAAGTVWTLSETMSVEDLPDEQPLKLYAKWNVPARFSYCFNNNWPDPEDIEEVEYTGHEGETITLDELLDEYPYDITEILEAYQLMFIGCSVNEPFPLIDSSNYDEIMEELNNTDFLEEGDSYELTADDTTFYAIWADFDSLSDAGKALTVNYRLGSLSSNGYSKKSFYYLKDDMVSHYDETTGSTYYELPLPHVNEIIPEWNTTPSGTIKEDKWRIGQGQEIKEPGEILEISAESTVELWSEIKVPVIQYWNGGSTYNVEDENADSIMSNPGMEKWVYEKTWPLPPKNAYWMFEFWGSTETSTDDDISALNEFAPVSSLEFVGWYDEEKDEVLEPNNQRINLARHENFPIKLEARWNAPEPSIKMVNVPGGTVNVSTASADSVFYNASSTPITLSAFQIGQTEVTYAQWCEVYDWARNNGYSFAQPGQPGNGGEGQSLTDENGSQPATNMSWRDVIVWCNAASEYKNLEPVYYENGTGDFSSSNVIREAETSSVTAGQGKADNITVNPNANGYRLPTEAEWEYAARGGNPDAAAWNYRYAGSDTCSDVAKRDYSTTTVKSLTANSLGLYDMCGNAGEFVWKKNSSSQDYRYYRGGTCNSSESNCTIASYSFVDYQTSRNTDLGFRVVTGGIGNFGNL